jgi:hypothetical protein
MPASRAHPQSLWHAARASGILARWSSLVRLLLCVAAVLGFATSSLHAATASVTAITVTTPPSIFGAGSTVSIVVTFSEAVQINGTVQFPLNSGGNAAFSSIDGTKTIVTFHYLVAVTDHIANSGNLDATALISTSASNGITCVTAADTPATWSWPATTLGSAGIQLGPTVQSIVCADSTPSSLLTGTVHFTVTYSEPVQGVTASSFGETGTVTTFTIGTPTPSGLSQTFTVPVTFTAPLLVSTMGLSVQTGPTDQLGNHLLTAAPVIDQSYTFDRTVPTCAAITTASANPTNGEVSGPIYQVLFSVPVSNVLSSNFAASGLTTNPGVSSVQPVSTPPCSAYLVTMNTVLAQGANAPLTLTLVPQVGTITSDSGVGLTSSTVASSQAFTIDQVAPAVTSIVRASVNPTTGLGANAPVFQVSFSEPVTGVSGADFTLAVPGQTAVIQSVTPAPTSFSATYTVTLAALANVGSVGNLTLTMSGAAGAITDAAGNALSSVYPVGQVFSINQSTPTVTGITLLSPQATNGTTLGQLTFQVGFSQVVTGVTASSFTGVSGGGVGALTVSSINPTTGASSSTYVVTLDALPNTGVLGTVGLTVSAAGISGLAGNAMTSGASPTNPTYSIDQVAPTVVSMAISGSSPTNGEVANQLQFVVTFSAPVTNVGSGDFTVSLGGASPSISSVTPSLTSVSSVYTITLATLPAAGLQGSLTLSMSGLAGGITDALGNALTPPYPASPFFTIDQTQPSVQSITAISANPGTAQLQFQVQFSTAVTGVTTAAFSPVLAGGLSGTISVSAVNPSGATASSLFTVTLSPLTTASATSGTLGLGLASFAGIQDALGNLAVTTAPGSSGTYAIAPPQIVSVSCIDPNPNPAPGPVRFLVAFSAPVSNVSAANFPFLPTSIITAIGTPAVSSVSASSYVVQVGGIGLANGVDSAVLPLVFNAIASSTIRDPLGNVAVSTLPLTNNTAYVITTEQPVLTLLGTPVVFQEHAAVGTVQVFNCTAFSDTGSLDFVSSTQQGTIDATIFTPIVAIVAPGTVSSDGQDSLGIQPASGDPFSVTGVSTSPGGNTTGNLLLNGTAVGSFTYSSSLHNLHILITGVTTISQVPRLINDIVFSNAGPNPSNSGREVFLSLTDGNSKSSATYTQNITMSLYNDTLPAPSAPPGALAINPVPAPHIVQPGQTLSGHIPTSDVDSFFVSSLYNASGVMVTPSGISSPLTLPTAQGSVTLSLYGDWTYTANAGSSGADAIVINVHDIGPGQGHFSGGDPLLPAIDITQRIFIVTAAFQPSSPSFTSNPPVEIDLGSAFDYLPSIDAGVANSTSTFFDLIDLDTQGLVANGTFQIDATTGEVTCSAVPNTSTGYIRFAVLMEVTDLAGTTRGAFQPIVLKVVNSTSGGG